MIDIDVPAGMSIIVHKRADGSTTVSVPEHAFVKAMENIPAHTRPVATDRLSCVYPIDKRDMQ